MNKIFTGKISKGQEILDAPHQYAALKAALEGKRIELVLRQQRKQRSNPQNRYYWGVVLPTLANFLGYELYELEELHEALKHKFLSVGINPETGLIKIKSTADLSTVEFDEHIEKIKRWAAKEFFIYIPEPGETE